jgi:hypothetical protein
MHNWKSYWTNPKFLILQVLNPTSATEGRVEPEAESELVHCKQQKQQTI